jgi:hypothetical protein
MDMTVATACGASSISMRIVVILLFVMVVTAVPILRRGPSLLFATILPVLAGLLGTTGYVAMTVESAARSGGGLRSIAAGSAESLLPVIAGLIVSTFLALLSIFPRFRPQRLCTRWSAGLGAGVVIVLTFLLVAIASVNGRSWFRLDTLLFLVRVVQACVAIGLLAALVTVFRHPRPPEESRLAGLLPVFCAVAAAVGAAGLWSLETTLARVALGRTGSVSMDIAPPKVMGDGFYEYGATIDDELTMWKVPFADVARTPDWEPPAEPPLTLSQAVQIASREVPKYTKTPAEYRLDQVEWINITNGAPTKKFIYVVSFERDRELHEARGTITIPVLLDGSVPQGRREKFADR